MAMKGKIKWSDPDKGYGYIIADGTEDPTDTLFFDVGDTDDDMDMDALSAGTKVVFEVEGHTKSAKQVRPEA